MGLDESQRPGNDVNDVDVVLFFFFAFLLLLHHVKKGVLLLRLEDPFIKGVFLEKDKGSRAAARKVVHIIIAINYSDERLFLHRDLAIVKKPCLDDRDANSPLDKDRDTILPGPEEMILKTWPRADVQNE